MSACLISLIRRRATRKAATTDKSACTPATGQPETHEKPLPDQAITTRYTSSRRRAIKPSKPLGLASPRISRRRQLSGRLVQGR
jgi:hypothetical protein